ncbi:hypothetical protein KEM52_006236 [Ascosphaera acerosa]|nr:hypothetical protein KEM52_006236 [Ascosphaera acerosa]
MPSLSDSEADTEHKYDHDSANAAYLNQPLTPPAEEGVPPNFAEVVRGVYRSSFPQADHVPALKKLGLKTMISLVDVPYSAEVVDLVHANGTTMHNIQIMPNKRVLECSPQHVIDRVLEIVLDPKNHPILIHCNKGRHRTGCIVGCFRRLQRWPLPIVIAEYKSFAAPKDRFLDQVFIQNYNASVLTPLVRSVGADHWVQTALTQSPRLAEWQNALRSKDTVEHMHGRSPASYLLEEPPAYLDADYVRPTDSFVGT